PALREPVTVPRVDVAGPSVELCGPCSAAHVPKSRKEIRGTVLAHHRRNVVLRKGASFAWLDAYRLRFTLALRPTSPGLAFATGWGLGCGGRCSEAWITAIRTSVRTDPAY